MENELQDSLNPKPSVIAQIFKFPKKMEKIKIEENRQTNEQQLLMPVAVEPKKQVMSLMDTLLTLFIVSPLIVGQWRGTWDLMDTYESAFPAWESFLFGGALHLSFAIMRNGLQDLIKFKTETLPRTVLAYTLRRLYTYFFAAACIMNWRGGWIIADEWLGTESLPDGRAKKGENLPIVIGVTLTSLVLLAVLRSFRNILAAPFVIGLDTKSTAFDFPTRYRISMEEKTSLYILDCLFSVFIIGTLVVFVWRGAWVLIDIYLFPENEVWSAWASLVLGYAAVALAFLMQPALRWICDRIGGAFRLVVADIFLLFSFVGTVNVWRGIWNLLNLYFIPGNLELSAWITHWACLILLILLKCSNTLLVRGVYIDAEEPAGKCVVFPIYYLRLIFQHERAKKITKKFQLEAMARRKLELESIKSACTCGAEIKNHVVSINKEVIQNVDQNHQQDV